MSAPGVVLPRGQILNVAVHAIDMHQAVQTMHGWVARRSPHYVCVTPAHAVMDCYHRPALRKIYNAAGLTTPDGMAIVWLLRWQGFSQVQRVYGPDLLLATCEFGQQHGYHHYFYGGQPQALAGLAQSLRQKFPQIQIVGLESPPFRPLNATEEQQAVENIRAAAPDFVWVGLGSPRQETWIASHLERLHVPVLVGVGAAFDFLSGAKPQAPRAVQGLGLEWAFRLLTEPRRLWKRYLLGYPKFVTFVMLQQMGLKAFPME